MRIKFEVKHSIFFSVEVLGQYNNSKYEFHENKLILAIIFKKMYYGQNILLIVNLN